MREPELLGATGILTWRSRMCPGGSCECTGTPNTESLWRDHCYGYYLGRLSHHVPAPD